MSAPERFLAQCRGWCAACLLSIEEGDDCTHRHLSDPGFAPRAEIVHALCPEVRERRDAIPEAAIEAAARAIHSVTEISSDWGTLCIEDRDGYRVWGRASAEAILSLIADPGASTDALPPAEGDVA